MRLIIGLIFSLLSAISQANAEKIVGGPKGGRLLEAEGIKAEFFVEKDHSVNLTFYNDKLEKIPVTTETATMIAETTSGKKKIEFNNKNGELFSNEPLPEGHGYNVVVQIKNDENSKTKNFRIPFEMSICGGCKKAEYACTCDE